MVTLAQKKDSTGEVESFFYSFVKNFRWNISIYITDTDMQASAKLKIGLKKMKCSPPQNGIHWGHVVSIMGK